MPPTDEPIGIDQCHCHAARRAARRITRFYESRLKPTGLKITQFLILAVLNERGATTINALAERLDTERTAMGKMVGFLERDSLVRVAPSAADGRSRMVELTAKGTEIFEIAAPLWREAQRSVATASFSLSMRPSGVSLLQAR